MKGGHTPGPWVENGISDWYPDRYEGRGGASWTIIRSESADHDLAIVMTTRHHEDEQFDANARLITAAPDLLEALIRMSNEVRLCGYAGETGFEVWLAAADEAIAKATGLPLKSQGDS